MILPSCSQRHGIPRGVKGLEDDIVQGVQPDSEAWAAAVVLQEEAYGTVIGFTDKEAFRTNEAFCTQAGNGGGDQCCVVKCL